MILPQEQDTRQIQQTFTQRNYLKRSQFLDVHKYHHRGAERKSGTDHKHKHDYLTTSQVPTQSVLTVNEPVLPTSPVVVFTGSSLTHPIPEFTGPATVRAPEFTGPVGTTESSSRGLSNGVKAGVGVGVVVGVLVLAGLLWFAYTMGKRRSRAAPSDPPMYGSVVHEGGRESKMTRYNVGSIKPGEKGFVTDKAHGTSKSYASDSKA